jgi:hypothetical protein
MVLEAIQSHKKGLLLEFGRPEFIKIPNIHRLHSKASKFSGSSSEEVLLSLALLA